MTALDALETSMFRDRHPDLVLEIHRVDAGAESDLSFPNSGRAIFDDAIGGYVLVWRDASARWHFIDVSDAPEIAAQVNKPPYVSPDASFLQNALDAAYSAAAGIGQLLSWLPWLIVGYVALEIFRGGTPARSNPPRRRRRLAPGDEELGPVEKIFYRKRNGHGDCDPACRAAGHPFVHTFKRGFPVVAKANGKLEI